ncbi:hypothetical protein AVEN_193107-1 [Araneus ventricosus]|uniref:Uncharacterized protein n=1 Tax=Araneus ventricosus TaxID=182803 RepID=A0A4Y2AZY0_ARAVE|nr:hypothetical protein AVEN_193107-1 [Araneus ventricosus]
MSFYLTLPSDSSLHYFPKIKISSFVIQFPTLLSQALVLYTDRSKSDSGRTGSGVYAKAEDGLVFRCRFRNPDSIGLPIRNFLQSEKPWISPFVLKLATPRVQSNA